MAAQRGNMACALYQSAFSGEVVFEVKTSGGQSYEGIAPRHYAEPADDLSDAPTHGHLSVRVIRNGGGSARVRMPDGETIDVPADTITEVTK